MSVVSGIFIHFIHFVSVGQNAAWLMVEVATPFVLHTNTLERPTQCRQILRLSIFDHIPVEALARPAYLCSSKR